jgi:hypothetical protein
MLHCYLRIGNSNNYSLDSDIDNGPDTLDTSEDKVDVDKEGRHKQAALEATQYALTQPRTKTAYAKALKEGLEE